MTQEHHTETIPENNPDTLISLSSSPLDRTILYLLKTSTDKPWAFVSTDEALVMVTHADSLQEAFPYADDRPDEVQAIIDEGHLAEGLLYGFLNTQNDTEESICDDCCVAGLVENEPPDAESLST